MKVGLKTLQTPRLLLLCKVGFAIVSCMGVSLLASAASRPQLSNLSDGNFDRQLEIPESQPLVAGSEAMKSAMAYYAGMPFDIGERIKFVITYMGVSGGVAELMIRTPVAHAGTFATRVTGEVKSADWYRWAVDIHEAVECLFDSNQAPVRFYLNQQEVNFYQSKILNFTNSKVNQITKRKGRDLKTDEFTIGSDTKDALAAFYYLREQIGKNGDSDAPIKFPIFTSEKTWLTTAQRLQSEKKSVGKLEFDTDVFELSTEFGGLMQQQGRMKLWMTRDTRRLLVYAEANIKFGQIKMNLTEWDQGFVDGSRKQVYPQIRN